LEKLLAGLRAAAEATRIRILYVLSHGEFNVSELTQVLGQSQPRVSRHLKLMSEAGLINRYKEGNWVLFRLSDQELGAALARAIVNLLPGSDEELSRDLTRIEDIRTRRQELASEYFRNNAKRWEELRSLHVSEQDVEQAMLKLAGVQPIELHLDLGTGTGSVLRSFANLARQSIGIDQSREMLAISRINLADCRSVQLRQVDIYALPFSDSSSDFITIHQVLHYLDDPQRALQEATRVLSPGGRLLIVEFAPHELEQLREEHAHRRLGIASDQLQAWLARAGTVIKRHEVLPPPGIKGGTGLTVSLWLAEKPGASAFTKPLAGLEVSR